MTITEALGTSTPTSITVVETSTSISPAANLLITASLTSLGNWPWSISTRNPASGPLLNSWNRSSTATAGAASLSPTRFSASAPDEPADEIRGQTTYA